MSNELEYFVTFPLATALAFLMTETSDDWRPASIGMMMTVALNAEFGGPEGVV